VSDSFRAPRLALSALAVGALALLAATAVSSLWWGFGRDQAIFAWVGDVILRGGVPYRDAWELKGPGTPLFFALAEALFGRHLWAIRVLDLSLLAASLLAAGRWLGRALDPRSAAIGVALFGLAYASGGYWYTAQADGWIAMTQLVLLALLFASAGRRLGARELFGAGLLIGLATTHKPLFALSWLALLPALLAPGALARRRWRDAALSLAGVGLPLAALTAWFAAHGALGQVGEVLFGYNLRSHLAVSLPFADHAGRWLLFATLPGVGLTWVLSAAGAAFLWRERPRALAAAAILLALDVASVILGKWYFEYHFLPLLAVSCVLAGAGVHSARTRTERWGLVCAVALVLAQRSAVLAHDTHDWLRLLTGVKTRAEYDDRFGSPGRGYAQPTSLRAAEYLAARAEPGDCALIWAFDPLPLFASGVPSCDRFGFNLPLVSGEADTRADYRAELLRDLERRPPRFVVVATQDTHNMAEGTSDETLAAFAGLRERLERDYELRQSIDHYRVYARRTPANVGAEK
jgi:hypothetical protein